MVPGCVFCGASKRNKEHVYPRWLRKATGNYSGAITIVATERGTMTRRSEAPFDVTVKAVCPTCNNGWMRDLEEEARPFLIPMIHGGRLELNQMGQRVVARWFVKTAMMMHEQAKAAERLIPATHFVSIHKGRRPAPGTSVWLATQTESFDGPISAVFSDMHKRHVSDSMATDVPVGSVFYSAGLVIGALGFIALGNTTGPECCPLPSADAAGYVVQIWPSAVSQVFPPRSTDDQGGFKAFYDRLFA